MMKLVRSASSLWWRSMRLAAPLTLLWWLLSNNTGWYFGTLAIGGATLAGLAFSPTQSSRWSLLELMRFLLYFGKNSLLSGLDVAYRAVHPRLPLQPRWLRYPLRLPPQGPARTLFVSTLTLLPGTLGTELDADSVLVHTLSDGAEAELAHLEARIAALLLLPP
jgi:multicomponent Na+:H+ antiporter subunit E